MRAELCGPYPPHFSTFQRFHSSIAKTLGLWSNRKLVLLPCAFANDADSRSNEACFGKSFLLPAFSTGNSSQPHCLHVLGPSIHRNHRIFSQSVQMVGSPVRVDKGS